MLTEDRGAITFNCFEIESCTGKENLKNAFADTYFSYILLNFLALYRIVIDCLFGERIHVTFADGKNFYHLGYDPSAVSTQGITFAFSLLYFI